MEYIVVDFEWNQSPYGKGTGKKTLPFEIIEIGAVKLDEKRNIIDTFDAVIQPKVYKKLHHMTMELTGITQEEIGHGALFTHTIVDFLLWCGDDFMFCTWGNTDLVELQRNMKYYRLEDLLVGPLKYYNVQKLFRILKDPMERPSCSLESAVELLGLSGEYPFHRAINDARYTAQVFAQMDMDLVKKLYSVDYYQNPQTRQQEIHLDYETHSKYISREFSTKRKLWRIGKCGPPDAASVIVRRLKRSAGFWERTKLTTVLPSVGSMVSSGERSGLRKPMKTGSMSLKLYVP